MYNLSLSGNSVQFNYIHRAGISTRVKSVHFYDLSALISDCISVFLVFFSSPFLSCKMYSTGMLYLCFFSLVFELVSHLFPGSIYGPSKLSGLNSRNQQIDFFPAAQTLCETARSLVGRLLMLK